jgi:hypothetical protein
MQYHQSSGEKRRLDGPFPLLKKLLALIEFLRVESGFLDDS